MRMREREERDLVSVSCAVNAIDVETIYDSREWRRD